MLPCAFSLSFKRLVCALAMAVLPLTAPAQAAGNGSITASDIRPMAEQGDANAQFFLGSMYRSGHNAPQDYAQAIEWYRKSAEQGDLRAQYNLGMMYSKGEGVAENNAEAARWFEIAAGRGHVPSQYNLGVLYGNGRGVPLDIIESHKWFSIAAQSGDADAIRERDLTAKILTPAQLRESRQLSETWLAANPQSR